MKLFLNILGLLGIFVTGGAAAPSPECSGALWVNAQAQVAGNGSPERPFKTIQEAAQVAGPGTTIHVLPGIYRERVIPKHGGEPGRPIIYQSETLHGAVVTGSDVWNPSWRDEGGGIFSGGLKNAHFTDQAYVDGGNPYRVSYYWERKEPYLPPSPHARVNWTLGQVFEDDRLLTETSSRLELAATAPAWWFDTAANRIQVNLGGQNPADHQFEITTRRGVFRPQTKGLGYIEVRGFIFEHCANQFPGDFWRIPANAQSGMVGTRGGHDWVIANNIIRFAKSIGLTFGTSGDGRNYDNELPVQKEPPGNQVGFDRIEGNIFAFNGAIGAMGRNTHEVVICSNLFYGNNALLNTSYETGGIKTHFAYGLRVEHNWFINNDCEGIWLDNTWKDCVVARNIFAGNRGKNVFFEMDDNTHDTASRVLCNIFLPGRPMLDPVNRRSAAVWQPWSVGVYGHDASGVDIAHNLFAGGGYGIYFRRISDRKRGCANLTATDNIFAGNDLKAVCLPVDDALPGRENYFDANLYPAARLPFVATGWSLPGPNADVAIVKKIAEQIRKQGGETVAFGDPTRPPAGYCLSLEQWRTLMGFDRQSRAADLNCTFDSQKWILTLTMPEKALSVAPVRQAGMGADFFGQPFSGSGRVGPFANLTEGQNRIQLPRPNFPDDPFESTVGTKAVAGNQPEIIDAFCRRQIHP